MQRRFIQCPHPALSYSSCLASALWNLLGILGLLSALLGLRSTFLDVPANRAGVGEPGAWSQLTCLLLMA